MALDLVAKVTDRRMFEKGIIFWLFVVIFPFVTTITTTIAMETVLVLLDVVLPKSTRRFGIGVGFWVCV